MVSWHHSLYISLNLFVYVSSGGSSISCQLIHPYVSSLLFLGGVPFPSLVLTACLFKESEVPPLLTLSSPITSCFLSESYPLPTISPSMTSQNATGYAFAIFLAISLRGCFPGVEHIVKILLMISRIISSLSLFVGCFPFPGF